MNVNRSDQNLKSKMKLKPKRVSQPNPQQTNSKQSTSIINNWKQGTLLLQQIKYKCSYQHLSLPELQNKAREINNFHTMTSVIHEIFFTIDI